SGECISSWKVCNGVRDCSDGSDENNCTYACTKYDFTCSSDKSCIPLSWRCDGVKDCRDNSDESFCSAATSKSDEIIISFSSEAVTGWCDGRSDCDDGSDENFCPQSWFRVFFIKILLCF
ncbi:hypothetical protein HELRODRAFT_71562, partial [Helobdella robusta]|uniref:Uncharacterized protein n=1 Tax=Helobdella robusta TaxID=6412 RepID=T1G0N4_HELRO